MKVVPLDREPKGRGLVRMEWTRGLTVNQTFVKDLDEYTPVEIEGLDCAYSTPRLTDGLEALANRRAAYG